MHAACAFSTKPQTPAASARRARSTEMSLSLTFRLFLSFPWRDGSVVLRRSPGEKREGGTFRNTGASVNPPNLLFAALSLVHLSSH